MTTEQAIQEQLEIIKTIERKRRLVDSGLTEADLIRDIVENKILTLNEAIEYLQGILRTTQTIIEDDEGFIERIDAITRTQRLLDQLEQFTVDILAKGISDIKQLLTDMNDKLDSEAQKNDELRELEKETLDNINKYLGKYT